MKDIEILYEDNLIIVVNKPAGLAVQGGKGVKSSLDKILSSIRTPAPLLVHRLDKDTSGILLAAKNREAAGRFSRILGTPLRVVHDRKDTLAAVLKERSQPPSCTGDEAGRKAVKQYIAVCAGCPGSMSGSISLELSVHGSMKKSETRYKVIKSKKKQLSNLSMEYSIVELEPGTGRMHQIRRHLAMIGNPILGDDKYGNFALNKKLHKEAGLKRLLLHSSRLVIREGFNLDIQAPLPDYFREWTDIID